MSKYWEVFGEVRDVIRAHSKKRQKSLKAMFAFQKKVGGYGIGLRDSIGATLAIQFKESPGEAWKFVKDSVNMYVPKRSTKEGKELAKEMDLLTKDHPSSDELNKVIGAKMFYGLRWMTPGYTIFENRVLIVTCNEYEPPKNLARWIKRIADTLYEKLSKG